MVRQASILKKNPNRQTFSGIYQGRRKGSANAKIMVAKVSLLSWNHDYRANDDRSRKSID